MGIEEDLDKELREADKHLADIQRGEYTKIIYEKIQEINPLSTINKQVEKVRKQIEDLNKQQNHEKLKYTLINLNDIINQFEKIGMLEEEGKKERKKKKRIKPIEWKKYLKDLDLDEFYDRRAIRITDLNKVFTHLIFNRTHEQKNTRAPALLEDLKEIIPDRYNDEIRKRSIANINSYFYEMEMDGIIIKDEISIYGYVLVHYDEICDILKLKNKRKEKIKKLKKYLKDLDLDEFYEKQNIEKITNPTKVYIHLLFNRTHEQKNTKPLDLYNDLSKLITEYKHQEKKRVMNNINQFLFGMKSKNILQRDELGNYILIHYDEICDLAGIEKNKKKIMEEEKEKIREKIKEGFDKNVYISLVYLNGTDKKILADVYREIYNKSIKGIAVGAAKEISALQKQAIKTKEPVKIECNGKIRYVDMIGKVQPNLDSVIAANKDFMKEFKK